MPNKPKNDNDTNVFLLESELNSNGNQKQIKKYSCIMSAFVSFWVSHPFNNQVSHGVSPTRMCSHKSCAHTTCNLTMQEKQHGTRKDEEGKGEKRKGKITWHSSPSSRTTKAQAPYLERER